MRPDWKFHITCFLLMIVITNAVVPYAFSGRINYQVAFFSLATVILLMLLNLVFHLILINMLRERHVEVWERLGKPSLYYNNSTEKIINLGRFILKKEYKDISDRKLIRFSNFLRIYLAITAVLVVVFMSGGLYL